MNAYNVGDVVEYDTSGERRVVKVDEKDDDIKNYRPGFGGIIVEGPCIGLSVWGYNEQIVRVR